MRGRKPKPTYLKLVAGKPGHRALNTAEPQPTGALTTPPDWFTPAQREIWESAIDAAPPGLLKRLDASMLVTWVAACDLHRTATQEIAAHGAVRTADDTHITYVSPYVGIAHKQAQLMIKAASELGFSPSSRSRVKIDNTKQADNRFAHLKDVQD